MNYNNLQTLVGNYINNTEFRIPIAKLESSEITTLIKNFFLENELYISNPVLEYLEEDKKIKIKGKIIAPFVEHNLLPVVCILAVVEDLVNLEIILEEFPPQWQVTSFIPEIKGTLFDNILSQDFNFSFTSEEPSILTIGMDTNNSYYANFNPIQIEIINLNGRLHLTKLENEFGNLDGDILGEYVIDGMFDNSEKLKLDIKFFTVSNDEEKGNLLDIVLPQGLVPKIIDKALIPILKKFSIDFSLYNSVLMICSLNNVDIPEIQNFKNNSNLKIQKGVTFFSFLSVEGGLLKYLNPIFSSLNPVKLGIHYDENVENSKIYASLISQPPSKASLSFTNTMLFFSPIDEIMGIGGIMTVNIADHPLTLNYEGELSPIGEQEIKFSLPENQKKWDKPLGINSLALEDIGVTLKLGLDGFSLMVQGAISIGREPNEVKMLAALQLINGTLPNALYGKLDGKEYAPDGIPLDVLLNTFSIMQLPFPLLKLVAIKYFEFYVGTDPNGIEVEGIRYKGIFLSADVSIFDLKTNLKISFNDQGLKANGSIASSIQLNNFLKISDSTGTRGPEIGIDTALVSKPNQPAKYFWLSSRVELFDSVSDTVFIYVIDKGFSFTQVVKIRSGLEVNLDCTLDKNKNLFRGKSNFNIEFSGIEVSLHDIKMNVGSISCEVDMFLNFNTSAFQLDATLSFSISGFNYLEVPVYSEIPINSFNDISEKVLEAIKEKSEKTLEKVVKNPFYFLNMWWNKLLTFAEEMGSKLKELFPNISIDRDLNNFAQIFKQININTSEFFKHMKIAYNIDDVALAKSLKSANFSINEITNGLKGGLGITDENQIGEILNNTGFPISVIKSVLPDFKISVNSVDKCIVHPNECISNVDPGSWLPRHL
ncbi:hypothetical protein CN270_10805 [Priestia megaterium]|uniref:hypothetical protein n=1 Tax=Priestia megaterium TaxID=1404 RepID=UPI000BF4A7B1|nr:hypothetical protein [Priestia megaterium]PFE34184.1 hypothetical protein CN270_10805 [Priestia megaterium]